jgi:hypothetical protein
MRHRFRSRMALVATGTLMATAAVVAILSFAMRPVTGEAPTYRAARTHDGRPDLNGIWQTLNTANWDIQTHAARPGLTVQDDRGGGEVPAAPVLALGAIGGVPGGEGVVDGNEIPYQPWAALKKKENHDNSLTRDPEVKCYLPGVPRATYLPYPFQILQSTDKIMVVYEFAAASRTIHMDKVVASPVDTWMGQSHGHWEGDTLVVDVTSFNDQTWFDRTGNFHSDALHVIERYTPVTSDHLQYEATIEDPKVFTRPWTMSMPLYRRKEKAIQLAEYRCVEFVEELVWGHLRKEQVVRRWEGDFGQFGGTLVIDVARRPTKR